MPDALAASALQPTGAVSYRGVDEDPILPKEDVFFCFDLELPWDFTPVTVDGEVQCVERDEGEATVHLSSLLHGVGAMRGSGVRYSLIVFLHRRADERMGGAGVDASGLLIL